VSDIAPSSSITALSVARPLSDTTVKYACKKRLGAILDLPCGGQRTDAIRTKAFEVYIRDNIDSWFAFAQEKQLDVEHMEDIILVSGCTLVTSWAAAVFHDDSLEVKIPLKSNALENGGAGFQWGPDILNPGGVHRHNSFLPPVRFLAYVDSACANSSLSRMAIHHRINVYSLGAFERNVSYST
jgi:hypothetical protein